MEDGVPEAEDLLRPHKVTETNKELEQEENVAKEEEEEKGANSGIFNNLISNIMSPTTTTTRVDSKSDENIDEDDNKKKKSVGILEKIISHLPEDPVPTTEEASMLIQSVVD